VIVSFSLNIDILSVGYAFINFVDVSIPSLPPCTVFLEKLTGV
jgi:hypothetical protein